MREPMLAAVGGWASPGKASLDGSRMQTASGAAPFSAA